MTEQEWLKSSKPEALLQYLARKRTKGLLRKLRLLCCASCRRIEPPLPASALEILSTVEELIDQNDQSKIPRNDFEFPPEAYGAFEKGEKRRYARIALDSLQTVLLRDRINHAAFAAALQMREAVVAITGKWPELNGYVGWTPQLTARWDKQGNAVRRTFAELLRDVIGNPFRRVTIAPNVRRASVVSLAQGIHDDRAFDRMPILADALEEAGCTDAHILSHCRSEEPHVRGCWLVDLLIDDS